MDALTRRKVFANGPPTEREALEILNQVQRENEVLRPAEISDEIEENRKRMNGTYGQISSYEWNVRKNYFLDLCELRIRAMSTPPDGS